MRWALFSAAAGGICRWRQTGGCRPDGPREPSGDRECGANISPGSSGFCECRDGRTVRRETCDHAEFTCQEACEIFEPAFFECRGWRQTGDCSSDGPREEANDRGCDHTLLEESGYCECGGDRVVKHNGCALSKRFMVHPFTCRSACAAGPSYWEILGLEQAAPHKAIHKNFRRKSLQHHPDKDRTPTGNAKYREVREAYDVLGDDEKRNVYLLGGNKLLEDLKKADSGRGPKNQISISVDLAELYTGKEINRQINRKIVCRGCKDNPRAHHCRNCNEQCANEKQLVNVRMGHMIFQQEQWVQSQERCRVVKENIDLLLEPGTRDKTEVTFKGLGEQQPGMLPGDVIVKIKARDHPRFKRRVDTLIMDLEISLKEALLGFSRTFKHLDGHTVDLQVEGPIQVGASIEIEGEGMPKPNDPTIRGPLMLQLKHKMPATLTDAQRQAIEQAF